MTQGPTCTDDFGPFVDGEEALNNQAGYIDDLIRKGTECISGQMKRGSPARLTICDNETPAGEVFCDF